MFLLGIIGPRTSGPGQHPIVQVRRGRPGECAESPKVTQIFLAKLGLGLECLRTHFPPPELLASLQSWLEVELGEEGVPLSLEL